MKRPTRSRRYSVKAARAGRHPAPDVSAPADQEPGRTAARSRTQPRDPHDLRRAPPRLTHP